MLIAGKVKTFFSVTPRPVTPAVVTAVGKTLVAVRVQNPVVSGSSAGATYYHQFLGYITSLTLNQSTTEYINFSGTVTSTGIVDVTP